MAFGFGFNKQKLLSSAEKFVQQGKLQNAISEYEKILKNDSKDLTVTNTVGDLYARLGENEKAIHCFKAVGDAYATQGFTVKAIAMYKKITKIKSTLEGVLKLAELYTQQGLFNDARAQYLQVAEEFLRGGELEQAVRIFQKILEMDPENVAMRVRLGEVYIRLGKKNEAWQIFSAAADSLRGRGQLDAAEDILKKMLSLDPGNSQALLLRARTALEAGENDVAIDYLEKVADLDSHPNGLRDLLKAYLQTGRFADAQAMATKLLTVHNDAAGISSLCDVLMQSGQFQDALNIYHDHAERLLTEHSSKVLDHLHGIIGHVRENTHALNDLLELFQKAGDTTHISEVIELLAHAYVQSGDLAKARDLYQNLAAMEPDNPLHMKNYEQVVAMMGGGSTRGRMITAEEGAVMVDELEATAPAIDQHYPDAVALAVRSALTDADLFVSYNMPGKALVPLLAALPQAPRDVRLNQRLAVLHTRAERFAEGAVCCRTLESVYSEAGYPDEALRYGELASKYEERAGSGPVRQHVAQPQAISTVPWPVSPPIEEPAPSASAKNEFPVQPSATEAAPEFAVQEAAAAIAAAEFDLSEEWEGEASAGPTSPAEPPVAVETEAPGEDAHVALAKHRKAVADAVERVRSFLARFMFAQARNAMGKVEELTQNPALLASLRAEIAIAEAEAEPEPEVAIAEPVEAPPEPAPRATAPKTAARKEEKKSAVLDEFVSELESSLGDDFLPQSPPEEVLPAPAAPEATPAPKARPAAVAAERKTGILGEFVADLESALPESFLQAAPIPQTDGRFDIAPESQPIPARAEIGMSARAAAAAGSAASPAAPMVAAQPAAGSPSLTYKQTKIRPLAAPAEKFSAAGVDLAEMFGELKQDLEEEVAVADEDPETHYNLGVAFREMGLLDEAIGELQKVCQAVERGHAFPQSMQTYTWLAQCFLDKGVPEAAIRWYEKALKLPGLDADTRMALHYELASAYESAKNKTAALSHFMEVYGANIDYRDVAERIKALKS